MSIAKRATKEELIQKAVDIQSRIKTVIAKLQAVDKVADAAQLESEALHIDILVNHIKAATEETESIKIEESRLADAEKRIDEQLKRIEAEISGSRLKRATKDELIQKAAELESRLKSAIEKAKAAHHDFDVFHFDAEAKYLENTVNEIKVGHEETEAIKKKEALLSEVESRIDAQLKKIEADGSK